MTSVLIANAVLTSLSSFLANSGSEVAKCIGKDLYSKIKQAFHKEDQKQALSRLESEPLSTQHQKEVETHLLQMLLDKTFQQDVILSLHITPANTIILELILRSIQKIKTELHQLYPWWINASTDKKGEYQNRIEQLEVQLLQLEDKFFITLQTTTINLPNIPTQC